MYTKPLAGPCSRDPGRFGAFGAFSPRTCEICEQPSCSGHCERIQGKSISTTRNRKTKGTQLGHLYGLHQPIGSGSFGVIYLGTELKSGEEVAVKLENVETRHPQLEHEAEVYRMLADDDRGNKIVPSFRWYGTEGDYNAMVMELLGPSIEDLFGFCRRKFSLKTVLMLMDQVLLLLEAIHARGFIHRDIKPENLVIGTGLSQNEVKIIDFGLAKQYRNPETKLHMLYREGKPNLTGTARYASINNHRGIEQSRRDDLESLGYVMIYLCRGSLPWQGLKNLTQFQKDTLILAKKMTTSSANLCRGLPSEFAEYIDYCRSLQFDETPDYVYLRKLLHTISIRKGFQDDKVFDWTARAVSVPLKIETTIDCES